MEPSDVQGGHSTGEGRRHKGSVPNCASLGPWRKEPVSVCGTERTCCDLWSKKFFKVGGSISMDTLMCKEKRLYIRSEQKLEANVEIEELE